MITGIAEENNIADKQIYIKVSPYSTLPTIEDWKAQLKAWNEEGNPFTVWYVKSEEAEEIAFPEIPTLRGTTIVEISADVPAVIKGKYKNKE